MGFVGILIIAALTFGACYLLDKGFSKTFRNKAQHRSGLAVRLNKRYSLGGLALTLLGILAICVGIGGSKALLLGGIVVLLMGIGVVTYYLSVGVFYDDDSFLYTSFGKKSAEHSYSDILQQRLYVVQGGNVIIELYLKDGSAVSLQTSMKGCFAFLDHAFAAWCRQTGRNPEECDFHDPSQSLWFPVEEDV